MFKDIYNQQVSSRFMIINQIVARKVIYMGYSFYFFYFSRARNSYEFRVKREVELALAILYLQGLFVMSCYYLGRVY